MRWLIVSLVALCAVIASFNIAIDPSGKLGTGQLDPMSQLARDRAAKVELLTAHPDAAVVVLGTSRAKQLDPRDVMSGARAPVNAALVGADVFEARVLTTWLASRADDGATFPHVIVGVDIEGFRGRSLRGSGLLAVPEVRSVARRIAGEPTWLDLAPEAGELLLDMQTTRASWRTMRQQLRQRATFRDRLNGEDATRTTADFDEVGMPRETRAWLDPDRVPGLTKDAGAQIDSSIDRYRSRYDEQGSGLAPDSIVDLTELVRTATAHGDRPLVFITPAHPKFAMELDPAGRFERREQALSLLRQLDVDDTIDWIDCSDCVPGRDELWLDGAHPSPLGARVLAARLKHAR